MNLTEIDWKELGVLAAAAVGALYALARAVVVLTPTPKDNAALDAVGPLIRGICRLFGLAPNQGVASGEPPKPAKPTTRPRASAIILLAAALALLSGCATGLSDPRAQLVMTQRSYAAAVDTLAMARERGMFTQDQADRVTEVIAAGRKALDAWDNAITSGVGYVDAEEKAKAATETLKSMADALYKEGESK